MIAGAALAAGAAGCYGTASVLEEIGARRAGAAARLDPRLLWRLAHQAPAVVGMALDLIGWVCSVAALRSLPLFAVQAAVAGSVGVTILVASLVQHRPPTGGQWRAVLALAAGVVLVAAAANPGRVSPVRAPLQAGLAGALIVLAIVAAAVARHDMGPASVARLGGLAGLSFGITALAGRDLTGTAWAIVAQPAGWVLLASGGLGLLLYTTALQRGPAAAAGAALVAGETLLPAIAGVVLFGDRARPGLGALGVAGFVLAVTGARHLARTTPTLSASVA
jgi:drug/metabolite transporter (DMT)-like permease